jgi:16S rRNA (cytosine967-C5)-methyltransferase
VLRARATLDDALSPRVTADWHAVPEDVRDVLRLGAYQLLALDRVPAHAAVTTAVDLAKGTLGSRSAGFVNAVLRRVARDRAAGTIDADGGAPECGAGSAAQDLARRFSHPEWLVARWLERFGAADTARLLALNNRRPPVYLQPIRWSLADLRKALGAAGVPTEDVPAAAGIAVRGARVEQLPGFGDGGFVVQDPAQALALAHAAVPDGALVWDACAAPGGKTAALARRCRVIASDLRPERVARLRGTVRRAAPEARVLQADAQRPPFGAGRFDVVLVDAPCSATGTLAKHPDARWSLSPRRLERLQTVQAALMDGVAPTVRPGGVLVYMTCSLEPEENAAQVDGFVMRHPEFARDREDLVVFPPDRGTDGGYAARLVRAA